MAGSPWWKAILKFILSGLVRQGKAGGYIDPSAQKRPTVPFQKKRG